MLCQKVGWFLILYFDGDCQRAKLEEMIVERRLTSGERGSFKINLKKCTH